MSGEDELVEARRVEALAARLGVELPELPDPQPPPALGAHARLFGALGRELGARGFDVGGALSNARWCALTDALASLFRELHGIELDVDEIELDAMQRLEAELVDALLGFRAAEHEAGERIAAAVAPGLIASTPTDPEEATP